LFPFASRSFLANNLRFKVKVIDKAIVINVKIHKNERKRFYSSNKENLTCLEKSITTNLYSDENSIPNLKIIKQTRPVPNVLLDCVILFYYLTQLELFVAFSKVNNKIVKI
jgi:hypothetical protein